MKLLENQKKIQDNLLEREEKLNLEKKIKMF